MFDIVLIISSISEILGFIYIIYTVDAK